MAERLHTPVTGPDACTPEWHSARQSLITASDVPALFGISPWKTARQLYEEKLGTISAFDGNAATRRGRNLEPTILQEYTIATGASIRSPLPLFIHPEYPFLGCTPDAERCDDLRVVEAKAINRSRINELGEEGTDWIPGDWILQVQTQMGVMGVTQADVAVMVDVSDFRIYHVEAEQTIWNRIAEAAEEFHQRIQRRHPPPMDWQHPSTPELVKTMYRDVRGGEVELPEEADDLWRQYKKLGEMQSQLERERETLRARIAAMLGDNAVGRFHHGRSILVRHLIPEAEVNYVRKPYVRITEKRL